MRPNYPSLTPTNFLSVHALQCLSSACQSLCQQGCVADILLLLLIWWVARSLEQQTLAFSPLWLLVSGISRSHDGINPETGTRYWIHEAYTDKTHFKIFKLGHFNIGARGGKYNMGHFIWKERMYAFTDPGLWPDTGEKELFCMESNKSFIIRVFGNVL